MFSLLEKQAPAKQNAASTISTLSGRLQSATLLEDRRAAILGLRSFAKSYPASVASGGLRSLISCLARDGEDVDSTKATLETLLMLFNPDESSPEASDDIALWLADEFTQRQENITTLLNLLDGQDFFSRLYSLQLISAIASARLERTQECVYTAPLGISRLVAILEEKRDAVRSEGLLLLTDLTRSSPDIQKLVAFENAFERVFSIIEGEGGLVHGGIVVQDCLSLLANLLRINVSNQSYFRETGWVKGLAKVLNEAIQAQDGPEELPEWTLAQRDKNMWGLLAVLRLFLVRGSIGTPANQTSFWQHGIILQTLAIAFRNSFDVAIRSEALTTTADLIRGNRALQEAFGQQEVQNPQTKPEAHAKQEKSTQIERVNVISALLDLIVAPLSFYSFELRLAACECLKAYFVDHTQIKQFFLRRAIEGHLSPEAEPDNIMSILLQDSADSRGSDPYRHWFAGILLFHILFEDTDTKVLAMTLSEGDAEKGEEVITCIQNLSARLLLCENKDIDERISIAYLLILCAWLYEDHDAINDFLSEGSNVQSLIQLILRKDQESTLVAGLSAFLVGIIYEFSTKDSPVSRETLYSVLISRLGREQYVDKITKLREHPFVRDFEVLPQWSGPSRLGLPSVFFDQTFVDFLKDNFSRFMRAIDRAPTFEVPINANGVSKGISRELVDTLKAQVEAGVQSIQKIESENVTLERKLNQEQADHRKAKEVADVEISRIKSINAALQKNHEEDLHTKLEEHQRQQMEQNKSHELVVRKAQNEAQNAASEADASAERARIRNAAEIADLKAALTRLRAELEKASKEHVQDLQTAHQDYNGKVQGLEARLTRAEERASDAEKRIPVLQQSIDGKERARAAAQTELDDMLMVLTDLEESRKKARARLKALGEQITDDEDESDEDDAESE